MTSFEILAREYHQKWVSSLATIEAQTKEIDSLKSQLMEERRESYRLRDQIHTIKPTNKGKENT